MKPIQAAKESIKRIAKCEPIPINKVGDYCEGDDGNITLPIEFNEIRSLAIMDSKVGVTIATKDVWEAKGNLDLIKSGMKLQLIDGYLESPIGLLEKVILTSCGIEYKHTFMVVDFGK